MGWNGSGGGAAPQKPKVTAKKPSVMRGIVAGLVCAVVACVAFFYLTSGKEKQIEKKVERKPIPVASKVKLPSYRQVLTNSEEYVVLPNGVITNKPKTIAEAIAMVRLKPGYHSYNSVDEVFSKTNDFQIGKYHSLNLKTSTEAQLSLIATRRRDKPIPPMPPMPARMADDFQKALDNYLKAEVGDSEQDIKTKKQIEMLKEMMCSYVDKGMTPAQALQEIEKDHNRTANIYQLYRSAYIKMVRENSPDAEAFHACATEELRKKGAPVFDRDAKYVDED